MRPAALLVLAVLGLGACGPLPSHADGGNSLRPTAKVPDSGTPDAGLPDAGRPDAGRPDAGAPDAGRPDAGPMPDAGACSGTVWPSFPCAAPDLEGKLRCIPGMQVTKAVGGGRYDLVFTQPVDHQNPDAGTFGQRLVLQNVHSSLPMVLMTSGYDLMVYPAEPTTVFGANQLTYEHRFFADSRPVPTDWSKLNIRQAADDAHRIAQAFHWLYPAAWLETGYSKGGMTAVYHRRFHPCDVNGTVAYVAPTSYGANDPGYPAFLSGVGGATWAACRQAMTDFQRRVLTRRAQLVPQIPGDFSLLGGTDRVLELNTVELPFAFWQYTAPTDPAFGCAKIPGPMATDGEALFFLGHHLPFGSVSAADLDLYAPYYYQAATQLGGPAPNEAPLMGLIQYPGGNTSASFAPAGVVLPPFDTQAMPDVDAWLATQAERVMLVYGEVDPWSTNGFPLGPAPRDSWKYTVAGANHFAELGQLPFAEKKAAVTTLERWLGVPSVMLPMLRAPVADDARPRGFRSSPSRR